MGEFSNEKLENNSLSKTWDELWQDKAPDSIYPTILESIYTENIPAFIKQHNIDSNLTDSNGRTLLHVAVEYGRVTMTAYLIDHAHLDVNARSHKGFSVLHEAALMGHPDIVQMLVDANADLNHRDQRGWSVLYMAVNGNTVLDTLYRDYKEKYGGVEGDGATADDRFATVGYLMKQAGCDVHARTADGDSLLHAASLNGHVATVRLLLDAGVAVNAHNELGVTALHVGSEEGHTDVVDALIHAGADIFARDSSGNTVLHFGGQAALVTQKLIEWIDCDTTNDNDSAALHMAAERGYTDSVAVLLAAGATVDIRDYERYTPLHCAVQNGHLDIMQILLEHGANVHARNIWGDTILHSAVTSGSSAAVIACLQLVDVDSRNLFGATVFYFAATAGNVELMNVLLNEGRANAHVLTYKGSNGLHAGARRGHLNIVQTLYDADLYDLDATDYTGRTALDLAIYAGYTDIVKLLIEVGADMRNKLYFAPLFSAAYNGHADVVRLLAQIVDVNAVSEVKGRTPLHVAAYKGHIDVIRVLDDANVDFTATDENGFGVLHSAAHGGHVDVVRFLLEHKSVDVKNLIPKSQNLLQVAASGGHLELVKIFADIFDIDDYDKYEQTALFLAAVNRHLLVVEFLIDNNANVEARNCNGKTVLHFAADRGHIDTVKLLLERNADVNSSNQNGHSVLRDVAWHGHTNIAKLLIEANANINATDKKGFSILHTAVLAGHIDIVKLLLDNGADVTIRHPSGKSALHIAASAGSASVTKLLLEHGADINAVNSHGHSVLQFAIHYGHSDVAELLIERGALIPRGYHGYHIFKLIVERNLVGVMKCVIDARRNAPAAEEWGYSALAIAAECENGDMVRELVRYGVAAPPYNDPRRLEIAKFSLGTNNVCVSRYFSRFNEPNIF